MLVLLARIQHYRGKVGAVGTIGEVLGLQTYGTSVWECATVGALITRGEVSSIKLHARLCGVALQSTAALRLGNAGSEAQLAFFFLVQHVVVVEAMSELNLLVVGVDVLTESLRGAE